MRKTSDEEDIRVVPGQLSTHASLTTFHMDELEVEEIQHRWREERLIHLRADR